MAKLAIKKLTFRCSWGEPAAIIHKVEGLPEGFVCNFSPEEAHRPAGEWFAVTSTPKVKRRTPKRFKCRKEAESYAIAWATEKLKQSPPPAKRKVAR